MKNKVAFLILCLFSSFSLLASSDQPEQFVKVPVQSVIVYLQGAQITQSKLVTLKPGRNLITFTGVSAHVISKSIQATASGDVNIFAVSDKINYLSIQEESPQVIRIKDSLKLINEEITQLGYDQETFDTEKRLLVQNEVLSGKDKGVSTAELKLAADFYRSRIREINAELFKIGKKEKNATQIVGRLNEQILALNAKRSSPSAEVSILLSCQTAISTTLEIKYIVSGAGWAPSYELIAEDVNKPIELKYRAKVFNNTDVDWTDVKMKISSADPTRSASKPLLDPWYVNYNSGFAYSQKNSQQYLNNASDDKANAPAAISQGYFSMEADEVSTKAGKKEQKSVIAYEPIQVSELSAEFDIKNPYSIPSDSKPYIVEVTSYNLPATYKYYSAPKADRDAYMLARITGWEDLDLVEGPANVYFAGTFVGQSYIYTRSVDDTLDLSLGRDNKILVTRNKLKDFSNDKVIGNNRKVTYAYEIVVKNNRKTPIVLNLEDQLPVSQNNDITVDAIEISKAQQDVLSGKLSWMLSIPAGEQQKVLITYSIKYPRNKTITMKKFRTVNCPSF
jgi:uncharacterized protein (TIGR02231 family)